MCWLRLDWRCWAMLIATSSGSFATAEPPPNVVVVLVDDFGPGLVGAYRDLLVGERLVFNADCATDPNCAPDPPATPHLDWLASQGVLFQNAYANPVCSPTRSVFHLGRYSFRTGVGEVVQVARGNAPVGLVPGTPPLAWELELFGYATAMTGKLHLRAVDLTDPNNPAFATTFPTDQVLRQIDVGGTLKDEYDGLGYDFFAGSPFNPDRQIVVQTTPGLYDNWEKIIDGVLVPEFCRYATRDTIDDACALIDPCVPLPASLPNYAPCSPAVNALIPPVADFQLSEPWFLYVPLNAPHKPWHFPVDVDPNLCPQDCNAPRPPKEDEQAVIYAQTRQMVTTLDDQLGRLLAKIDLNNTYVFVIGDNGTVAEAAAPQAWLNPDQADACAAERAKGSLYEGGTRVPLLVAGPGIAPGVSDALIGISDLYATVCDLAGSPARPEDSLSFAGHLLAGEPGPRQFVFTEKFNPNFDDARFDFDQVNIRSHTRAVRDGRYKLIHRKTNANPSEGCPAVNTLEMFDLQQDPFEQVNLLGAPEDLANPMPGSLAAEYCTLRCELVALGVDAVLVSNPDQICACTPPCPGDATGDGAVDLSDLAIVLANFGFGGSEGDVTGDGFVWLEDLAVVLAEFGADCE